MKQQQRKATRIMPFAQFFGLAPRAEEQDDDDLDENRKQRDDESDEDYARRMAALEEESDDSDEDGDDDADAEDPEGNDDDDDSDHKPDADDLSDDEQDDDDKKPSEAKKAARTAERQRCAAIVAHGIKTGQTILACSFAFDTNLTAAQAKASLNAARKDAAASAPRHRSLSDRMASVQPPNPGSDGGKNSGNAAKTLADRIVAVGERVRGK